MNKLKEIWGKVSSFCKVKYQKFIHVFEHLAKKNIVMKFLYGYRKYIGAGLLFILMMIIMFGCTDKTKKNHLDPNDLEHIEFEFSKGFTANSNEALTKLITDYYKAYVEGDVESLDILADPVSDDEKSFIIALGQYFEEYQNIKVYCKDGIDKGSYFVSAYYDLKFYGITTTAPGLDFFYVETDKNGKLYINNLYSNYNTIYADFDSDPVVRAVKQKYQELDEVKKLIDDTTTAYQEAVAADESLASILSITVPNVIERWRVALEEQKQAQATASTEPVEPTTETEITTETQTVTETETETETTTPEPEPEPTKKIKVSGNGVNIRSGAGTGYSAVGQAYEGEEYELTATEGDWYKIDFKGEVGYIRNDFCTVVE